MAIRRNLPLDGVKVIDVGQVYQGPYAAWLMAKAGADVIKIEPLTGEPVRQRNDVSRGAGAPFAMLNGHKRCITLDLKSPKGVAVLKRLARGADVLLENFAPGVMDRFGAGWSELSALNPRLIYASGTGYGLSGPDRDNLAMDITVQAVSGVMSVTGFPDGPPVKAGPALADFLSGTHLYAGIVTALYERQFTGALKRSLASPTIHDQAARRGRLISLGPLRRSALLHHHAGHDPVWSCPGTWCSLWCVEVGHCLHLHVSVLQQPLVGCFEEGGSDQAHDAVLVGEDADDIGAALHLPVQPLQRACAVQLGAVLGGKAMQARTSASASSIKAPRFGDLAELVCDVASGLNGAAVVGLSECLADRGGEHDVLAPGNAGERVAHGMDPASLPCRAGTRVMAAFSPS